MMRPQTWFLTTVALLVSSAAMLASFNMALDIFGVFREAKGRRLPAYGDERVARYLLGQKYVPSNFNGVLIGSSVSANWNLTGIEAFRVYNDSLNGGNIVEAKTIVDPTLQSGAVRIVLLVVHPFLTYSHNFETVHPGERQWISALGSTNLLDSYREMLSSVVRHRPPSIDPVGTFNMAVTRHDLNPVLRKMMESTEFFVDPEALAAYGQLVEELHARKLHLMFVVPPLAQPVFESKRAAFVKYQAIIDRFRGPADQLVDFTSDRYLEFRQNTANFPDGMHMTGDAAAAVVSLLNAQLH